MKGHYALLNLHDRARSANAAIHKALNMTYDSKKTVKISLILCKSISMIQIKITLFFFNEIVC